MIVLSERYIIFVTLSLRKPDRDDENEHELGGCRQRFRVC